MVRSYFPGLVWINNLMKRLKYDCSSSFACSMNYNGWEGMIFIGVNAAIRYAAGSYVLLLLVIPIYD